ncbi:hypothetical protein Q5424_14980 [Conexibacter sp. JD483]|uniref:hypothetical protein n=1 Tax=unclassified Conexibacter TaxID=2627773 RepID=UPI0027255C15|nr:MULTISPECIES: hypothetical protein [unclassified Conexibacter]MDO8187983.1 hypothetical protein [Conexibacter sp. CPCC 205706]MDO8200866.1 hypothetical protein [Conexibacter sp. CPCC 205762]MDR9370401.1 hypothetical protein [Conexibacter sp. JD483]
MSGAAGRGSLELRGPTSALLDEPLALTVRGLGDAAGGEIVWRARLRDDDGRSWRATASSPLALAAAWTPGADPTGRNADAAHRPRPASARPADAGADARPSDAGASRSRPIAALQSLRPLTLDVRAESPDGRAAARSFTRLLLAEGVRVRRWRAPVAATLFLPPERLAPAALLLDATAAVPGSTLAAVAPLAAALLASRGVLTLVVPPGRGQDSAAALPTLSQVARGEAEVLPPPFPPGVPGLADADAGAWDELLARLGARPVQAADGPGGGGADGSADSAASSAPRPSGDSS